MEYQALLKLKALFPSDNPCGILTPVDYMEFDGYGAMITRLFCGEDVVRYARSADTHELPQIYHSAGMLLRTLHDACPDGYELRTLDVEPKLEYLDQTYGVLLRANSTAFAGVVQLRESAPRIAQPMLRWTWAHGDFKPENVLYDGHKIVVFDTRLDTAGAFVYDIASFLNHVLLAGHTIGGWKTLRQYHRLEAEFLAGYGGMGELEIAALRWTQLYFMLCYFAKFSRRGAFAKIYAHRRIGALIRDLARQLAGT